MTQQESFLEQMPAGRVKTWIQTQVAADRDFNAVDICEQVASFEPAATTEDLRHLCLVAAFMRHMQMVEDAMSRVDEMLQAAEEAGHADPVN